jgi:hypothetical protein
MMNVLQREGSLQRAQVQEPLFRICTTRCWPCLGRGRVGRGGRRICHNCNGTGRDWTLVPAIDRSAGATALARSPRAS